jgi:hypothetical protein
LYLAACVSKDFLEFGNGRTYLNPVSLVKAVPSRLKSLSLSSSFSMNGFKGVVSLVPDSCCSSAHVSNVSSLSSSTTLSSFNIASLERTLPSKDIGTLKIWWRISANVPWAIHTYVSLHFGWSVKEGINSQVFP